MRGPSGPLVYPAGHLHFYGWLLDRHICPAEKMSVEDQVLCSQRFFGLLYLGSLVIIHGLYVMAGIVTKVFDSPYAFL